jgi:RNA polymerase sigma factor (sigma-70 family)
MFANRRDSTVSQRDTALKLLRSRYPGIRAQGIAAICEMFEPLVKSQARAYRQHVLGADPDDLEQEARIGLLQACETFRPKLGAFPTHAVWAIRNALSKYVEGLGNPVKVPAWMVRRLPKLRRMHITLAHELLREPSRAELAEAMKMPERAIEAMQAYDAGPGPMPGEYGAKVGSQLSKPRNSSQRRKGVW